MAWQLYQGDCLEVLKQYPDSYFDSIVTDPPYELGFMGKSWDASGIAYNVGLWKECLRVNNFALFLKREFIGIELNPEYIEIAKRRIDESSNQLKLAI